MIKFRLLALAAALTAACGTDPSGNNPPVSMNDASVMEDHSTPAVDASKPDSSITEDASVEVDASVPVDSTPVEVDVAMTSDECWSQACERQDVYGMDGTHVDEVNLSCNMMEQRIGLTPAGLRCIAVCSGDTCSCDIEDSDGLSVESVNVRENGHCGSVSRFTYRRNGVPTTLISGIDHLVRRR